ncbi:MAG: hypothetical protein U1E05_03050 [Patescibacteria group bacterium]|nr:hypothetical protein [Patescibacteria group bacterium]
MIETATGEEVGIADGCRLRIEQVGVGIKEDRFAIRGVCVTLNNGARSVGDGTVRV